MEKLTLVYEALQDRETWRAFVEEIHRIRKPEGEKNYWEIYLGEDVWWEWEEDERVILEDAGLLPYTSLGTDAERMWEGKLHSVRIGDIPCEIEIIDGIDRAYNPVTFANLVTEEAVLIMPVIVWEEDDNGYFYFQDLFSPRRMWTALRS